MRLGIDFGTTRTVVAAAHQGRYPVLAFDDEGEFREYVPGLAVLEDDQLRFGGAAQMLLDRGADRVVRSIKREISSLSPDDRVIDLGPNAGTALELLTAYLGYLRAAIVERSSIDVAPDEPLEAMVAVPANASTRQRYLTLEAFTRAGFRVLGMVNEPTAGAIEFAYRNFALVNRPGARRYVVVYDLGGGTFDTSAVSLIGREFDLLATEGIARLGGDDFDEIILELALEKANMQARELDAGTRARLLESCRQAKESMTSTSRRVLIDLEQHLGGADAVVLSAAEIYERCNPLVARTLELLQTVFGRLSRYGFDSENPRTLGAVYLVGGAVAFPPVVRALRNAYRKKIQLAAQPHAASAIGLAVAADPDAGVLVREAVTRHFGVWREMERGREKVFDPILEKGLLKETEGTIVVRRAYRPVHTVGHLRFLECSRMSATAEPAGELTPCGEIFFPYDPELAHSSELSHAPAQLKPELSQEEIRETYSYSKDGTIELMIENATHGYRKRFVIGSERIIESVTS